MATPTKHLSPLPAEIVASNETALREIRRLKAELDAKDAQLRELKGKVTTARLRNASSGASLRSNPLVQGITPRSATARPVPPELTEALVRCRDALVATKKRNAQLQAQRDKLIAELDRDIDNHARLTHLLKEADDFAFVNPGAKFLSPLQLRSQRASLQREIDDMNAKEAHISIRSLRQDDALTELSQAIDNTESVERELFFMRAEVEIKTREAEAVDGEIHSYDRMAKRKLKLLGELQAADDQPQLLQLEHDKRCETKRMEHHEQAMLRARPTVEHQGLTIRRLETRMLCIGAILTDELKRAAVTSRTGSVNQSREEEETSSQPPPPGEEEPPVDAERLDDLRRRIVSLMKLEVHRKEELESLDAALEREETRSHIVEVVTENSVRAMEFAAREHDRRIQRMNREVKATCVDAESKVLRQEMVLEQCAAELKGLEAKQAAQPRAATSSSSPPTNPPPTGSPKSSSKQSAVSKPAAASPPAAAAPASAGPRSPKKQQPPPAPATTTSNSTTPPAHSDPQASPAS